MAEKIGGIYAEAELKTAKYEQSLKKAQRDTEKSADKMGNSFKRIAQQVGLVVASLMALRGAVRVIADFVKHAREQELAVRKVEQALKATGNAAGVTSKELQRVASRLQTISNFGDEEILDNVTANLLTFKQVSGDTFLRAQELVLDLSAALGQDLQSSAIMVGKALNDPILGLTALRRVGIQLSKENEELIKTYVELGNVTKAQGLILDELAGQFGGQAEAMAYASKQLQNAVGDLKEEFGYALMREVDNVSKKMLPFLQEAQKYMNLTRTAARDLSKELQNMTLEQMERELKAINDNIEDLENSREGLHYLNALWKILVKTVVIFGEAALAAMLPLVFWVPRIIDELNKLPGINIKLGSAMDDIAAGISGASEALAAYTRQVSELEAEIARLRASGEDTDPPGGDPDTVEETTTQLDRLAAKFVELGMAEEMAREIAKQFLDDMQELKTSGHEAEQALWEAFWEVAREVEDDALPAIDKLEHKLGSFADEGGKKITYLGSLIADRFSSAVSESIIGAIDGTRSLEEAFGNMAKSILADIAKMISQMLILNLLFPGAGLGFGLFNKGGAVGLNKGGIVEANQGKKIEPVKANTGRVIRGSHADRDSVLTYLTQGEHVVNRAAAEMNRGLLEGLNRNPFYVQNMMSAGGSAGVDMSAAIDRLVNIMAAKDFSPIIRVVNEISAVDVNRANKIGEMQRGGF